MSVFEDSVWINQYIKSKECDIINVIRVNNIKSYLNTMEPHILKYFVDNSSELLKIALGNRVTDNIKDRQICKTILMTPIMSFSKAVVKSQGFLDTLTSFIYSDLVNDYFSASMFSRLFQFFVQDATASFMIDIDNCAGFLTALLSHINISPLSNLFLFLSDSSDIALVTIFEQSEIVSELVGQISDDSKGAVVLECLISIIVNSESDSHVFDIVLKQSCIEKVFQIGMSSTNKKVSSNAFNLLLQICSNDKAYPEEESSFSSVLSIMESHIPQICNFIMSSGSFLEPKFHCVELIAGLVLSYENSPACIEDTIKYLFNQMFLKPFHSFLHRSFITLFEAFYTVAEDSNKLIEECNMKNRIIQAFESKNETRASYWGYLYTLSNLLSENDTDDKAWEFFYASTILNIKKHIDSGYGGPVPKNPFLYLEDCEVLDEIEEDYEEDNVPNVFDDEEDPF